MSYPMAAQPTAVALDLDALSARFDNYHPEQYTADFPHATFRLLREAGLPALALQPAYRPLCATAPAEQRAAFERQLTLLKAVGRGSLPAGRIYEGHVNAVHLIELYGTEAQQRRWYGEIREQQLLFGVWNTEMRDGVTITDLGDGCYRLAGAKTFCSGAGHVDRPIITGPLLRDGESAGWQMCVVPTEAFNHPERITGDFWRPLGMEASASYRIDFTGIELRRADLLGQPDDYQQQPAFSGGAVRFTAVHLGGAEALFDHTLRFLRQQERQNNPYQAHRLGHLATEIESGRQWLRGAAEHTLYATNSTDKVIQYANMVRTAISRICHRVLDDCATCVGARGFLAPHPVQQIYRDLTMYLRQPNPDGALADLGKYVGNCGRPGYAIWDESQTASDE